MKLDEMENGSTNLTGAVSHLGEVPLSTVFQEIIQENQPLAECYCDAMRDGIDALRDIMVMG